MTRTSDPHGRRAHLALLALLAACACPPQAWPQAPEPKATDPSPAQAPTVKPGDASPAQAPEAKPTDAPAASEPKIPAEGIFWTDAAHKHALFVSEEVLNSVPRKDLPIPEEYKVEPDYAAIAAQDRSYPRPFPECGIEEHSPIGYLVGGARTLPELLERSNLVLVGSVIQVIPGLFVADSEMPMGAIGSMVEVDVQTILKRSGDSPREGQRIFYRQRGGSIVFRGRRLCTQNAPGFEAFRAGPGQRVLLVANGLDPNDSRIVAYSLAWPISRSGEVLPQPYKMVDQRSPIPLQSLKKYLEKGRAP